MLTDTTMLHEMRPDILGGTLAIEDARDFIETVFFTDERAPARVRRSSRRRRCAEMIEPLMMTRGSTTCTTPGSSPLDPTTDRRGSTAAAEVRQH